MRSSKSRSFTAERKLKAGLTYRSGSWFVSPNLRWHGEMHEPETGPSTGQTVAAQTLMNLYAGYNNLWGKMDIALRIDNLLDKDVYDAGLGSGQFSFLGVPQQGRSADLSLKFRF